MKSLKNSSSVVVAFCFSVLPKLLKSSVKVQVSLFSKFFFVFFFVACFKLSVFYLAGVKLFCLDGNVLRKMVLKEENQ